MNPAHQKIRRAIFALMQAISISILSIVSVTTFVIVLDIPRQQMMEPEGKGGSEPFICLYGRSSRPSTCSVREFVSQTIQQIGLVSFVWALILFTFHDGVSLVMLHVAYLAVLTILFNLFFSKFSAQNKNEKRWRRKMYLHAYIVTCVAYFLVYNVLDHVSQ